MALNIIRLRRALSLSSTFINAHRILSSTSNSSFSSLLQNPLYSSSTTSSTSPSFSRRFFHSSHLSLSSSRNFNDFDKIDSDTILFEGCDYKHWLIVMDFGKDPQLHPSPQEMVETYVQTLAKVVGSVEEAKKRMYACSTTTYTGFQAEMDEETSQKFEGMPGVLFVLPDSYIDPVNKEYGGDKYINGTIIPRPPPVQYGRVKRHGPNERRPMHNSIPGEGRGYVPQGGNLERQNTPGQEGRGYPMPNRTNRSEQGKDGYQGGRNSYVPPHQGGRNTYVTQQGGGNTYVPPQQGGGTTYVPPQQGGGTTYVPPQQGGGSTYVPPHQGNYNRSYTHQPQMENFPNDARNYTPPTAGQYGPGSSGNSAQGTSIRYGPEYASQAENQRFSQTPDEQNSMSTEHRNYTPAMQTGLDQRKF